MHTVIFPLRLSSFLKRSERVLIEVTGAVSALIASLFLTPVWLVKSTFCCHKGAEYQAEQCPRNTNTWHPVAKRKPVALDLNNFDSYYTSQILY